MNAIEVTGLGKSFGDHRVLDALDLQVRRGEGEAGVQLQAIGGTDRGHPISAAARDAAA